jgi:hypothetical protein
MTSFVNKFRVSLTDEARVIIYDSHMFIVQATVWQVCFYTVSTKCLSGKMSSARERGAILFLTNNKKIDKLEIEKGYFEKRFYF